MRLKYYLIEAKQMLKQWQKYVRDNKELSAAVKVLQQINKAGYKAYIVGGSVRDIVLGIKPKDIDIATNMPINELGKIFKIHNIGQSKEFGIVVINYNGINFEIAQFRSESYIKPKIVRKILK